MINQPIQNGGLGQRGSPDNKMRSAYDNYNAYRGEMENARKSAEQKFDEDRLAASASMHGNSIERNSPEWNKTMAGVKSEYDNTINKINADFESYKTGPEFTGMLDEYKKGTLHSPDTGMSVDEFDKAKPSFDEFFDMQYGNNAQKHKAKTIVDQRTSNVINMRAR